MFEQRSHWVSLISGIGAVYLWTLFGIYGTVGIIGIIIAFIVGGMVGRGVWAGANTLTDDWFDETHTLPGVFVGLLLSLFAGFGIEASGILPGAFFYLLGAGGILGLIIGLRMDAKARRQADENYRRYQAEGSAHSPEQRPCAPGQASFRAYLIDPRARTIEERTCDGSLSAIQGLVGAHSVEGAPLGAGDIIYLDSAGLSKEDQHAFRFEPRPQPLFGKGLLIGTDQAGECADARIDGHQVQARVAWLGKMEPE